jgi:hypothetical protein
MTEIDLTFESSQVRRLRALTRLGVLLVWGFGVYLTIRSGWDPGPWWREPLEQWPYPLREVLFEIAKISAISLGLYDFIRPQPGTSSFRRVARAFGLLFVVFIWEMMFSWTDQPGYAYASQNYVLIVTAVLLVVVLAHLVIKGVRAILGSDKHAA